MSFSTNPTGRFDEIIALMTETFAASEGADEGQLIGTLARDLLTTTPEEDLLLCLADGADGTLGGSLFFSRLTYPEDSRSVFVMGPVAVAPACQGQGVGQRLIRFGHDQLRARGVDVALTYGNPAYYCKTGYLPITQDNIAAPYPLQHAFGWQGQSLTDTPLDKIAGPASCVPGFANPAYW